MPSDMPAGGSRVARLWRIPVWQPAALILFATAMIALDLYAGLSLGPLLLTAALALAALVTAGVALRYALLADEDGIVVRHLVSQQYLEWSEIADIAVTSANLNTVTIRISRVGGTYFDVPSTLVQPTLPTSVRKSRAMVGEIASELLAMRARYTRSLP